MGDQIEPRTIAGDPASGASMDRGREPSLIVIGGGPGIGRSVARRFAKEGYAVGIVARSPQTVASTLADLTAAPVAQGVCADATHEYELKVALDELIDHLGVPRVVVYNAAVIQSDEPGELSAQEHLDAWAVNVVGAITTAAHLLPRMETVEGATFIITGGMPAAVPQATSLSLGKAGVRALVELLDARFGPRGVHVATVTVGGPVAPGTAFDPDDIADIYWALHRQRRPEWRREVLVDGRSGSSDGGFESHHLH
jgi:NAD(P)-dependent dehydrogenase (short-subunit alcohol dehydrogenase family)